MLPGEGKRYKADYHTECQGPCVPSEHIQVAPAHPCHRPVNFTHTLTHTLTVYPYFPSHVPRMHWFMGSLSAFSTPYPSQSVTTGGQGLFCLLLNLST